MKKIINVKIELFDNSYYLDKGMVIRSEYINDNSLYIAISTSENNQAFQDKYVESFPREIIGPATITADYFCYDPIGCSSNLD